MKPTPAQAILLKEMSTDHVVASASQDRNDRYYMVKLRNRDDWRFRKAVLPATFQACLKRGWLEKDSESRWGGQFRISKAGMEVLANLNINDFVRDKPAITTADILATLRDKYLPPEWMFFPELRYGSGYGRKAEKRIDAWAMNCWPSKDFIKIAFEIKVYRSDFLKELKDPGKRVEALEISNQFYFIAPKGLIAAGELPDECGLMTVSEDMAIHTRKKAPVREISQPSWRFIASLGRRLQHQIERNGNKGG